VTKDTINRRVFVANYRTVPFVTKPEAPIVAASSWRAAHGSGNIERV